MILHIKSIVTVFIVSTSPQCTSKENNLISKVYTIKQLYNLFAIDPEKQKHIISKQLTHQINQRFTGPYKAATTKKKKKKEDKSVNQTMTKENTRGFLFPRFNCCLFLCILFFFFGLLRVPRPSVIWIITIQPSFATNWNANAFSYFSFFFRCSKRTVIFIITKVI